MTALRHGMLEGSITNATYPWYFVNFNNFKFKSSVPKYATLETGRNLLDSSFINPASNQNGITATNLGYISTVMSNASGNLSKTITITRTYNNNYTTPRSDVYI